MTLGEVSTLKEEIVSIMEKLEVEKDRSNQVWREHCEQLTKWDGEVVDKEAEISLLKSRLERLESAGISATVSGTTSVSIPGTTTSAVSASIPVSVSATPSLASVHSTPATSMYSPLTHSAPVHVSAVPARGPVTPSFPSPGAKLPGLPPARLGTPAKLHSDSLLLGFHPPDPQSPQLLHQAGCCLLVDCSG